MNLLTKKASVIFRLLATGVFCCCVLSGCRHTVPIQQDESVVLEYNTEAQSAYSYSYDAARKKINFTRSDWTFIRKKDKYETLFTVNERCNCFAFSDSWMQYSIWSGKELKISPYLIIPPLTLYPIVDSVILAACFVGDVFMLPARSLSDSGKVNPLVIPGKKDKREKGNCEILKKTRFDAKSIYTDYAVDKKTKQLSAHTVFVYDRGVESKFTTETDGSLNMVEVVPYLLPARTLIVYLDNNMNIKNSCILVDTAEFLSPAQKADLAVLRDTDAPVKEREKALGRLQNIFDPQCLESERAGLERLEL